MISEGGGGGGGNSNRQDGCAFLHSFTYHSSPHPRHAPSPPPHLENTPKLKPHLHMSSSRCLSPSPPLLFHFGGSCLLFPPLLCLCLDVMCLLPFLYKKKLFFLVSVRQSVCLSIFVRVAVSPAVWLQVKSGVTPWATSSGGLWGVKPFPSLRVDLTGGVLYRCPFFPLTPCVCLCVINVFSLCLCSCKDVNWRLEKSSSLPAPCVLFPV